MTRTSVLIPDGESSLTGPVVHCLALNKGINIHVLSKDPKASIRYSRFIASFHCYDLHQITQDPHALPNTGNTELDELIKFHHYEIEKNKEILSEIIRCAQ